VSELLVAFLRHADAYYRHPVGTPTSEAGNLRDPVCHLTELYGHGPAAEFGPLALKAVRQAMIEAGQCRPVVNQAVGRIKRVLKWAAGEELIPLVVYHRLTALAGLTEGRSAAREPEPVGPVAVADVEATLPFLNRLLAAMVRVQVLTGMRPGELCRHTPDAPDTSGDVWGYRPLRHKTSYRGEPQVVHIGPPAQSVLTTFLGGDPSAAVFSPRAARVERVVRHSANTRPAGAGTRAGHMISEPVSSPAESNEGPRLILAPTPGSVNRRS
jgi:integrase